MQNWKGELQCWKMMGIKPNFSELSRIYKKDRRVLKKYYEHPELLNVSRQTNKKSKLDKHTELIKRKLSIPGSNKKAVYMFIKTNVDSDIGSYSNFRKYVNKHADEMIPKNTEVHLRFETAYGKQLQFDWKGPIKLKNRNGYEFEFYIFSTTLGASRLHYFSYSKFMTLESVERCLIEAFEFMCGVPEECLTDNMSSIVNQSEHEFTKEFKAFAKDMGFNEKKCRIRRPETKGKDESANRFMSWLYPYDGEFDTEEDLIKIVKKLNDQINNEVNQTTNIPPIVLFKTEKEYLQPLPKREILDKYLDTKIPAKVANTLLVNYKGAMYSVPKKYIGQTVKLTQIDNKLFIYYNKDLIAIHEITDQKINYLKEHYCEGLTNTLKGYDDKAIYEMAENNLKELERLENKERRNYI